MTLQPGRQLAHYRLVEQIGEGGMGVVWRATDTTLDRDVAIKFLPGGIAADADRLQRFEREAKLLASLNHPHIATVHGLHDAGPEAASESGGSVRFLVMELVEGEDLSERIERGALPLERTVEIATQIADALEVAHGQGVIHRDLKPANIKLTTDGKVKVLDFGLAKALTSDPASGSGAVSPTLSPTMTSAGTVPGMILGTAAYMSPEQARGRVADRRADVWAFGCLVFEMLTGQRAFRGETISDTLASVLKEEPDWDAVPDETPPAIRRLLRRCLTKDPRRRLSDASDARLELAEALEPAYPGEQPVAAAVPTTEIPPTGSPASRLLPWVVAGVAIVAAVGSFFLGGDPATALREPVALSISLPEGVKFEDGQEGNLQVSPDGRYLVFSGMGEADGDLYLRNLGSTAISRIPGTTNAASPFFSPDSRWIAFFAGGKLKKVPVEGGSPITICDSPGSARGASWGGDDEIVYSRHFDTGLFRVSGAGGEPTPLTELDESRRERTHRWPHAVTGHDVVLFTVATLDSPEYYDDATIDAVRISTGERTTVLENASMARYLPTGHLIFGREGFLFTVPFDIERLETTGSPVPAVEGVMGESTSGAVYASIAETGLLAYVAGLPKKNEDVLTWHHFDGRTEPVAGAPVARYVNPALSPDGNRVAVSVSGEGAFHIWVYDLERQSSIRLTFEGSSTRPVWTPDGKSLMYYSVRNGIGSVYMKAADGSGQERQVYRRDGESSETGHVSPDGRAAVSVAGSNKNDIYIVPLDDPDAEAIPFVATPADEHLPRFSPDGRWLAYTSDETGGYKLFVRPFPGPGGRWQISQGTGIHARWSADGKQLYYRGGRELMAVDVDIASGDAFRSGTPRTVLDNLPRVSLVGSFDVWSAGERALIAESSDDREAPDQITVVVDWLDSLRLEER